MKGFNGNFPLDDFTPSGKLFANTCYVASNNITVSSILVFYLPNPRHEGRRLGEKHTQDMTSFKHRNHHRAEIEMAFFTGEKV